MYASTIRQERYGAPIDAFEIETVDVPSVGPNQALVMVMAAGINFNNVWAATGRPLDVIAARRRRGATEDFHIGGSEGAGVVWAVGENVRNVKVGDPVVLTGCQWDETAADIRMGVDPMMSKTQTVWGYEENYGSFAQYALVDDYQCLPKPNHLTWEEASCFLLTAATAYRQLLGWTPNVVRAGDPVLIWGGAGGLGSMAIQIVHAHGGHPVAVISDPAKADHCKQLGAVGVIDRNEFDHWGRMPDIDDAAAFAKWVEGARAFGKKFWDVLGERRNPTIVFEHSGQATIPTSMYVCENGGMVVICGGTSGYNADVDLRFLWMRQKRLQGSHFANLPQCAAVNRLAADHQLDPCLSATFDFADNGKAHQLMHDNVHPPGNMSVLVNAPHRGLTDL
jgi:crotonyl-CoA carboxylase/reductase